MILNKQKRIKYLGFNDVWFFTIGILILSFVTDYLFNKSFVRFPLNIAVVNWSISLLFTICNWFFMRYILIYLRIKFPEMSDSIKRIFLVFLILVVSVILIDFLGNSLLSWFFEDDFNPLERSWVIVPVILISTMVQAIYEAIYHYTRLKKSIIEKEQAKQMAVMSQLEALRNRAQPHFFFNTLNTLRDIIDQNSKEEAKKFVDKLADIYRFILEVDKEDLISFKKELEFSKAYLHVQQERFGENLLIHWEISDKSLDMLIVPMSLELLIENAIKHNIVSKSKPLEVFIESNTEFLVVKNRIQLKSSALSSTKMGLKNIYKRYTLISTKEPVVLNDGETFKVSVPLLDQKENNN